MDWSEDGFPEIVLAVTNSMEASSKFLLPRSGFNSVQGSEAVLALELDSPFGASNRDGLGAKVTYIHGGEVRTKVVGHDGGNGRLRVTIPVESQSGVETVHVEWPNGWTQEEGIPVGVGGKTHWVVEDNTRPTIVEGSVVGYTEYLPLYSTFEYVFVWDTVYPGESARDCVVFDTSSVEPRCAPEQDVYWPTSNGVRHSVTQNADGTYCHELRVAVPCSPRCDIPFRVVSSYGAEYSSESVESLISVGVCGR